MDGPEPDETTLAPKIDLDVEISRHTRPTEDVDFVQVGEFWRRVLDNEAKDHLVSNLVRNMGNARERIQYRQTSLFYKAEPEYGSRVAEGLDLDIGKVKKLAEMTQEERVEATKK